MDETTSELEIADPMVGTYIEGKYRVDRLLGQGGMGKVFKVTHLKLSKTFALKLMHPAQVTANPANLVRFEREAEALARINVVMVTDFGVLSEKNPYIVMEYIEGISLRKLLKTEGQLSERQAINITKQICAGLHEAHRQEIVHRDLKPENIMIQVFDDGEKMARVLDFGIAVMKESSSPTLAEDWSMGTLKYMSPEQMYGVPLDARSDIFTICLMVYEMLTGTVPIAMMGKVLPLCDLRPSITATLGEIIHRGISLEPSARQRTVLELKRELETVEQETMFQGASDLAPAKAQNQNRLTGAQSVAPHVRNPRATGDLDALYTNQHQAGSNITREVLTLSLLLFCLCLLNL
ncbi:MAG: serine/threonine protein kinase [bacterium]|nr:MAG: serine/threonine protein kinase [bacterium]